MLKLIKDLEVGDVVELNNGKRVTITATTLAMSTFKASDGRMRSNFTGKTNGGSALHPVCLKLSLDAERLTLEGFKMPTVNTLVSLS